MSRYSIVLLALITCFLYSCKQEQPAKARNVPPVIDSLINSTLSRPAEERLRIFDTIRQIAEKEQLKDIKFRSYCLSAIAYSLTFQDKPMALKMMDSARQYMESKGSKDWLPVYHLYLSTVHQFDDTAVSLLEKVIPHLDQMEHRDKLLALSNFAILQGIRGNYKIAIEYNIRYLKESRDSAYKRNIPNEITTLNNLFISLRDFGDTPRAFTYLSEAEQLIRDSLPGTTNVGVIYINLGSYYLFKENADSARYYFNIYKKIAADDYMYAQPYLPYLFFAATDYTEKQYARAERLIDTAQQLFTRLQKEQPQAIEHPFLNVLYDYTYKIKKANHKEQEALYALEQKVQQDKLAFQREKNDQILEYERLITSAKAEKEIADKEQKIAQQRTLSLVLLVLLLLVVFLAIILVLSWKRKKEKETHRLNLFEKEAKIKEVQLSLQAESLERQRISKELHDELGSTLTRIKMSAHVIRKESMPHPSKAVDILEENCGVLLKQANEIVWSLNDSNDNLKSLVAYINRFCADFLASAKIAYTYTCNEFSNREIEGFKRRAIYHTVKEVINNAVRHSGCTKLNLAIEVKDAKMSLLIKDNGRGISGADEDAAGNGLSNIAQNINRLNGTLERWTDEGTGYNIAIPIGPVRQ